MEGVFAIVFLFGGGSLIALSFTPLGRAIADRIRHGATPHGAEPDPVVYEELERVRQELAEVNERLDFAERLLGQRESAKELPR
ncbi:MAG TPA: hypothetical protein VFT04_00600 [Gemmatimonadales bacterium]|nr:hypothetical protein [Gemmatimonadales bacterium]